MVAAALSAEQVDALLQPLDPRRVKQANGQSHLEAWDVRRHLIRVFGYGGWSFEVISCDCILERSFWSEAKNEPFKGRHTVIYRVVGRLTIKDSDGLVLTQFEDGATGDSTNQPTLGDAHDLALKTAMSQALKRCAVNLGDRFGLSLYNKGATGAVVGKSLAHEATTDHQVDEAVTGGELDEQRHAENEGGGAPNREAGDQEEQADATRPSVATNTPAPASFHEHDFIRSELKNLDPADLKRLKDWWKQQHLPSIAEKDSLTAGQYETVLSFLDELREQRERVDTPKSQEIADRMRQRLADEQPEDQKQRSAGVGA